MQQTLKAFLSAAFLPFITIVIACAAYISSRFVLNDALQGALFIALQVIVIACLYWFLWRVITKIAAILHHYFEIHQHRFATILVPFISSSLKAISLSGLISLLVNYLPFPSQYAYFTDKLSAIIIICIIAWILFRLINLAEQIIFIKYNISANDNLLAQKAHTQIVILKRIVISAVVVLSVGAILMLFDNVREFGTSILASAGIAGIIAGLAAQKSLNSLIIGLQIALNQPIKLNDYVVVENEFGQIEEITVYYVVVKIWDLRRLIVPINYFVEKPFQNLSRYSTELIGTVFLYTDYTLPIEPLREKLNEIVKASPLWDKNLCNLQVSDAKENVMEIRILVTARNPGDAWNLRCDIREKLITYIREHYPNSLPKTRIAVQELTGARSNVS